MTKKSLPTTSKRSTAILSVTILIIILTISYLVFAKVTNNNSKNARNTPDQVPGLLSINTDKAQYSLKEQVNIHITSLDGNGNTLCSSNLKLSVSHNNETIKEPLISNSPSCDPNNTNSLNPDYTALFTPENIGEHQINLINLDNNTSINAIITVQAESSDFSISRWGATRINPFTTNRYPMKLTLTSTKDFSGQLIEQIPPDFEVVWHGSAIVEQKESTQTITWNIDIQEGESKELIYEYKTPQESFKTYLLGTASLQEDQKVIFEESRPWQITTNSKISAE